MTKICTRCKETKYFDAFTKDKNSKDGFARYCKPCQKVMKHESYLRNRESHLAKCKEYRDKNPEKVSAVKKKCYHSKKEQYAERSKQYYLENREMVLKRSAEYRKANREKIRARDNAYKVANREVISKKQVEYQRRVADKRREYIKKYVKERRQTDKLYALRTNIRSRFKFELAKRGESKWIKVNGYLGCSWLELQEYLKSQFTDGMSWDNYGDWHVDHIIPLAIAENRDELIKLCHHTNLRPLWASDNISKGAKILDEFSTNLQEFEFKRRA